MRLGKRMCPGKPLPPVRLRPAAGMPNGGKCGEGRCFRAQDEIAQSAGDGPTTKREVSLGTCKTAFRPHQDAHRPRGKRVR